MGRHFQHLFKVGGHSETLCVVPVGPNCAAATREVLAPFSGTREDVEDDAMLASVEEDVTLANVDVPSKGSP